MNFNFLPVLKRNAIRFAQSAFIFGIIYLILELFGVSLESQDFALKFAIIGYGITYANIYIGTVTPEFLKLKENDLVVKLCQIFQLASPFIGLSTAAHDGVSVNVIYCIIFVSVVILIRWDAVKKQFFEIVGMK